MFFTFVLKLLHVCFFYTRKPILINSYIFYWCTVLWCLMSLISLVFSICKNKMGKWSMNQTWRKALSIYLKRYFTSKTLNARIIITCLFYLYSVHNRKCEHFETCYITEITSINYLLGTGESYGPTAQHTQDSLIFFIKLNYCA